MTRATASSWKTLAAPQLREPLEFSALFDDAEAEALMKGLIPKEMEDKWFIYFEEGWLLFHRSWTGICIYGLRLDGSPAGVRVVDSWVNRDPEQYRQTDLDYDRRLVRFLIDALLLRRSAEFPLPAVAPRTAPEAFQQSVVGRVYRESDSNGSPRKKK